MDTTDTLFNFVADIRSSENHLLHMLRQHVTDSDLSLYPQAQEIIRRLLARSEQILPELEICLKDLGSDSGTPLKDTVSAISGVASGTMISAKTLKVTSMLRESYSSLAVLVIDYELLHARGNALGSLRIGSLALSNLQSAAILMVGLSHVIVPVSVDEMSAWNSSVNRGSIPTSVQNINSVWHAIK